MSQSISELDIELPPKLVWVFEGEARYRGAYGGRGSGKTFSFAKMTAVRAVMFASAGVGGIILCGREFMNSLDDSSMAEVKAAIASDAWLTSCFDVGENYIRTKAIFAARVEYKFAGLRHNLDSIKSKSRILILWIDEAEPVTENAWQKIIPTVRAEGAVDFSIEDCDEFFEWNSEIWLTWNPEDEESATNQRFRNSDRPDAKIVEMNYKDNPWFPDVLERERQEDERTRPDSYGHVWNGDYRTHYAGAYFTQGLSEAKEQGRISYVNVDKLLRLRAYCDIGGVTRKADAFTMWICQFVGREIRVLNYYEAKGQELSSHIYWLNQNGYPAGAIDIYLPHDGAAHKGPYRGTWEDAFADAGYTVETIIGSGSGGAGAPLIRIEAVRRLLPQMWFNEPTTAFGRKRLASYHEHQDEKTGRGLGPKHDDASHAGDAFGLMAIAYEEPGDKSVSLNFGNSGGWMAG